MAKVVYGILFLVIAGSYFVIFVPPKEKEKLAKLVTNNTNEQKCFDYSKDYFKDPKSAEIIGSYITNEKSTSSSSDPFEEAQKKYREIISVAVRAKNGYGAYGTININCAIIDGEFDEVSTLLMSKHERFN